MLLAAHVLLFSPEWETQLFCALGCGRYEYRESEMLYAMMRSPKTGSFCCGSKSIAQFPASGFRKFAAENEDEAEPLAGTLNPDGWEVDYKEQGMISISFSWTDPQGTLRCSNIE